MSFVREPFRDFTTNQLNRRVKLLEQGLLDATIISPQGTFDVTDRRDSKWYAQYVSKTAFLRVAPLVVIKKGSDGIDFGGFESELDYTKNFVLEGVPLKYENDSTPFKKMAQFPSSLSSVGNSDSLLNNPILRTSPDKGGDGFGIVPPPGVLSFKINTKSFYGNLREGTLVIRCFNIAQFEIIERLYARPGHHVLVEWGWSHFINEKGEIEEVKDLISDIGNDKTFWSDSVEAGPIYRKIDQNKIDYEACYDGILGIVKNFSTQIESDGGFTVNVQIIGRGDLIDSMKLDKSGDVDYDSILSKSNFTFEGQGTTTTDPFSGVSEGGFTITTGTSGSTSIFSSSSPIDENGEEKLDGNEAESEEEASNSNLLNLMTNIINQTLITSILGPSTPNLPKLPTNIEAFRINPIVDSFLLWDNFAFKATIGGETSKFYNEYGLLQENGINPQYIKDLTSLKDTGELEDGSIPSKYQNVSKADIKAEALAELNQTLDLIYASERGNPYTNQNPNIEAGLGPYVRLGYLIKCLNGLCIPNDGKGKPMVTISNLLYTNKFEPNSETFEKNLYPSCYSALPFDTSLDDSPTKDLVERKLPKTFTDAVNNSLEEYVIAENDVRPRVLGVNDGNYVRKFANKLGGLWKGYAFPDNKFVREQASLTYLGDGKGYVHDIKKYQLLHAGSCTPSKVLFPHQFQKNTQSHTVEGGEYAKQIIAGIVEGTFLYKYEANSGITKSDFQGLFSLPITAFDPITQKPRGYFLSEFFTATNWSNASSNAPSVTFDPKGGSYLDGLSSQAISDAVQFLYDQNKITEEYYYSLFNKIKFTNVTTRLPESGPKTGLKEYLTELESASNKKYNKERVIDNIYLNSFWLDEFIKKNSSNLTIDKLLGEICSKINAASGGSTDLKVITNPVFNDMISIIDFNINTGALKESKNKMFVFPKSGGYTSLYKKLNLSGKIPSAMASTIAIAAQGPRDEGNIASTTYKTFIVDVEDRLSKGKAGNSSPISLQTQNENKYDNYRKKYIGFFKNAYNLMKLYSSMHMESPHLNKEWFTNYESSAIRATKTMVKNLPFLNSNEPSGSNNIVATTDPKTPLTAILPLKITITTEGISGILASNVFKIAQGMLPERYNSPRVSYMVSKESQTVKGMVWETTIEGSMVLDDSDTKSTTQQIKRTVTPTVVKPPSSNTVGWTKVTTTGGGFSTKEEGDKFRGWVLDNIGNELIAELFTRKGLLSKELDRTSTSFKFGDTYFEYVKTAYNEWGAEYEEFINPTPVPLDNDYDPSNLSNLFEEEEVVEEVVEVEDPYFEKVSLPIKTYTTPEGYEAVIVSSPRGPRTARADASSLHGGWDLI